MLHINNVFHRMHLKYFFDYHHFFFLKKESIKTAIVIIITQTTGYINVQLNSGIYLKFIPYNPTINVKGMKTVEIMVKIFITSFILLLILERYISSMLESISLKVSTVSMIWMTWSYKSRIYIEFDSFIRVISFLSSTPITSRSGQTALCIYSICFLNL